MRELVPVRCATLLASALLLAAVACSAQPSSVANDAGTVSDASTDGTTADATVDGGNIPDSSPGTDSFDGPPPCAGVSSNTISGAIDCAELHCSTGVPSDPSGRLTSKGDAGLACLLSYCPSPFGALQVQSAACFDCITANLEAGATFVGALDACP
jgi:hypothetical protein